MIQTLVQSNGIVLPIFISQIGRAVTMKDQVVTTVALSWNIDSYVAVAVGNNKQKSGCNVAAFPFERKIGVLFLVVWVESWLRWHGPSGPSL